VGVAEAVDAADDAAYAAAKAVKPAARVATGNLLPGAFKRVFTGRVPFPAPRLRG